MTNRERQYRLSKHLQAHIHRVGGVSWKFSLLQNTEILRALQKASGLSPDDEPIRLLSVPKGALGNIAVVCFSTFFVTFFTLHLFLVNFMHFDFFFSIW